MRYKTLANVVIITTNICPDKFVIRVHQGKNDDRVESLIVVVGGTRQIRASTGNMLSVKGTAGMGKVPPLQKLLSNLKPAFRSGGGVITSSRYSSTIALQTSRTTTEIVFAGTLHPNFMSAYLDPDAR